MKNRSVPEAFKENEECRYLLSKKSEKTFSGYLGELARHFHLKTAMSGPKSIFLTKSRYLQNYRNI